MPVGLAFDLDDDFLAKTTTAPIDVGSEVFKNFLYFNTLYKEIFCYAIDTFFLHYFKAIDYHWDSLQSGGLEAKCILRARVRISTG